MEEVDLSLEAGVSADQVESSEHHRWEQYYE